METLKFSTNWNNKLNCKCFTTFRLYNPKIHYIGAKFDVVLKNEVIKRVEVIECRRMHLADVNEWVARIDTGYSKDEFKEIVQKIYGYVEDKVFCLLLLNTIKE